MTSCGRMLFLFFSFRKWWAEIFVTFFCWKLWEMIWVISETKRSYFKLSKNPVGSQSLDAHCTGFSPTLFSDRGTKNKGQNWTFICLKIWFPFPFASNFHTKVMISTNVLGKRGEKSGVSVAPWPLTCEHLTLSSSDHYCIRGKKLMTTLDSSPWVLYT